MKSNKSKSAMTALVIAAMICTAAMPVKAEESKWVNNGGNWSLVKADGSKATGWVKDGECWYAFDENGSMRTGWVASHEHWYFMGKSGVMQVNTMVEDNGATYFVKSTGVMAKDYVKDGYEFTSDGKAIPLSESKSVVLTDASELEGKVIEGNLYVDITTAKEIELKGVTVKGKLVIVGDNETAGKVTLTDSTIDTVSTQTRNAEFVLGKDANVDKFSMEELAEVKSTKDYNGKIGTIEIQSTTKGTVVIEVPTENVSTNSYAPVEIKAPVENLEIKTETAIKVDADVKNLTVTETATDTKLEVKKGSTIGTVTADAPVKIEGEGTVEKVEANVDGVEASKDTTIKKVETGEGVKEVPDATKPDKGSSTGGSDDGGSDTKPTVKQLTVSKINYTEDATDIPTEAINNQKNITLTTNGNVVTVRSNNTLETFKSSNAEQGEGQWIGFIMDTGESSILGLSVNTGNGWHEFTQADIDEAATVGAGAGKFVFWMEANVSPERIIQVRKGNNGTIKSVTIKYNSLVGLAEKAKKNFDSKQDDMDWDTVITAAHYYDQLSEAAKYDNNLNSKLEELTKYYAGIKTLDLSNKDTSKFDISTGALVMFTGLEELNLSNTGIYELGGLVNMESLTKLDVSNNQIYADLENDNLGAIAKLTNIKELNLSGNKWIEVISAIMNLEKLETLDISGTSLTELNIFWNYNKPRFANLNTLYAKNIDSLISIAGLVEVANYESFVSEGKTWDLSGSFVAQNKDNHIQQIKKRFTKGTFKEPTVPTQLENLRIEENTVTKEQVIRFEPLDASTGVTTYEYITWLEEGKSIRLTVPLDKILEIDNIYKSLEDLVADFRYNGNVNKIVVNALKDKEVIASSVLDVNLNVIVENSDEYFTVNKLNIEDENEIFEHSISSNSFNKLEYGKDTVTLFWLPVSESDQSGKYTWHRIVDLKEFEEIKNNKIIWSDNDIKEELKFAINILSKGEFNQVNNSYTIRITYLNNGRFVSASDKAPTKAEITIDGVDGEDKTFQPLPLLEENEQGMITEEFKSDVYEKNLIQLGLKLTQGESKKVRLRVSLLDDDPTFNTGKIQFIIIDSEGIAWNIIKSGYGPADGFDIPTDITPDKVFIVGEPGTYMGGVLVEDVDEKIVYGSTGFAFTIADIQSSEE